MKITVTISALLLFAGSVLWFGYREISKKDPANAIEIEFMKGEEHPAGIPELGEAPDFNLIGIDSARVSLDTYAGKVLVVDFIFTTCAGPCPKMTKNMATLHEKFKAETNFRIASVTVDPDYDTPQVLYQYAKSFQADTSQWHFLTGSIEAIENFAVKGLKLPGDVHVATHSSYFVLIDPKGQLRGFYNGLKTDEVEKLAGHVQILLKELS